MKPDLNRLITPDLLKGFAVIFMIQVHILELFTKQSVYDGLAGKISLALGGVPAAPVFMLVMGYFLAYKEKDGREMIYRGVKLFLAGILLNIGLNLHLAFKVFYEGWDEFVNIYHYWFGVDILHLAGLSLVVMGLVHYIFKSNWIPWLILALVIPSIGFVIEPYQGVNPLLSYLFAFIYSHAEWSYFPLVPWLAYPLTGYAFRLAEMKYSILTGKTNVKMIAGGVLLILILISGSYGVNIMTNLPLYYHHGVLFFAWAIGLSLVWAIIVNTLAKTIFDNSVNRYIRWLGENVTLVYIVQWLIIGNIATALFKTQTLLQSALWFIAVLTFSSLITWLVRNRIGTIRI